jgi:hypothetical protein
LHDARYACTKPSPAVDKPHTASLQFALCFAFVLQDNRWIQVLLLVETCLTPAGLKQLHSPQQPQQFLS